jgi:hypothetical protein
LTSRSPNDGRISAQSSGGKAIEVTAFPNFDTDQLLFKNNHLRGQILNGGGSFTDVANRRTPRGSALKQASPA